MAPKYIHTLLVAIMVTLSTTGCGVSASLAIAPPGQVISGIMGTTRAPVMNQVPDADFVDIIDECKRIHARLGPMKYDSINPRDVRCVYKPSTENTVFMAVGYRVTGKDTVAIGSAWQTFYPNSQNYPWVIKQLY